MPDLGYDIAAGLLLILLGVLSYQKKTAPAFIVLVAAIFILVFGHLSLIDDAKATLGSVEIKLREVNADVDQVKKLASLLGESIIDNDRFAGALGGIPAKMRDTHRASVLDILKLVKVDQSIISEIEKKNYESDVMDYVWGIERSVQSGVLKMDIMRGQEWVKKFNEIAKNWPPSPDAIQELMTQMNITDPQVADLLRDYRFYVEKRFQRRPEVWADRDHWPGNS